MISLQTKGSWNIIYLNTQNVFKDSALTGVLLPRERLILERAETDGDPTPRPLVVIDCKRFNKP